MITFVNHMKAAEWLTELRVGKDDEKQDVITTTIEMVIQQPRKIPNWKCPGPHGITGFWLNNFTALQQRMDGPLVKLFYANNIMPKEIPTTIILFTCDGETNNRDYVQCFVLISRLHLSC